MFSVQEFPEVCVTLYHHKIYYYSNNIIPIINSAALFDAAAVVHEDPSSAAVSCSFALHSSMDTRMSYTWSDSAEHPRD